MPLQLVKYEYIIRYDIEKNFEESILDRLANGHMVLLGFPGVGKSTSAKGIAAIYNERKKDSKLAVILSIDRTINKPKGNIELVKIKDKPTPIPIANITIPFRSIKGEDVLKEIINTVYQQYGKLLGKTNKSREFLSSINEKAEPMVNIVDKIVGFFVSQPSPLVASAQDALEIAPYVSTALKLTKHILSYIQNRKFEELEKRNDLLIIVDDLADLRPNWQILSPLFKYSFHYIFTIRIGVDKPEEYISILDDKMYASQYLRNIGIPFEITNTILLDQPSFDVFGAIMQANRINPMNNQVLWQVSGGIPALALMISGSFVDSKIIPDILKRVGKKIKERGNQFPWETNSIETKLCYIHYVAHVLDELLKRKEDVTSLYQPTDDKLIRIFKGEKPGNIHSYRLKLIDNLENGTVDTKISILKRLTDEQFEALYNFIVDRLKRNISGENYVDHKSIMKSTAKSLIGEFVLDCEQTLDELVKFGFLVKDVADERKSVLFNQLYKYTSLFDDFLRTLSRLEFGEGIKEYIEMRKKERKKERIKLIKNYTI